MIAFTRGVWYHQVHISVVIIKIPLKHSLNYFQALIKCISFLH